MSSQTQGSKPKKAREASDIWAMVNRMFRSLAKRAADGDMDALGALTACETAANGWAKAAVANLRAEPWNYSWSDIGDALGVSRQAAQQRFGG
jgi:hypothetical protein